MSPPPFKVESTKPLQKKERVYDKPAGEKPPGCEKGFVGNVAYEATDEELTELFSKCGEIKGLRWLTNQETGEVGSG